MLPVSPSSPTYIPGTAAVSAPYVRWPDKTHEEKVSLLVTVSEFGLAIPEVIPLTLEEQEKVYRVKMASESISPVFLQMRDRLCHGYLEWLPEALEQVEASLVECLPEDVIRHEIVPFVGKLNINIK